MWHVRHVRSFVVSSFVLLPRPTFRDGSDFAGRTQAGLSTPKSVGELKLGEHAKHTKHTKHRMHLEIEFVTKNTFLQYEGPDMVRASESSAK